MRSIAITVSMGIMTIANVAWLTMLSVGGVDQAWAGTIPPLIILSVFGVAASIVAALIAFFNRHELAIDRNAWVSCLAAVAMFAGLFVLNLQCLFGATGAD